MKLKCLLVPLILASSFAGIGSAQSRDVDVAVGWSLLRSFDAETTMPLGFHFGVAGKMRERLGIAGDFSWNHKGKSVEGIGSGSLNFTTFSAGPRYYFPSERSTGFFHLLAGLAHGAFAANVFGFSIDESETKFMLQPGGGVDLPLQDNLRLRFQVDYQWIFAEGANGNLRFVAAAFWRLGR